MKKILGVIFLSLVLSGNAFSNEITYKGNFTFHGQGMQVSGSESFMNESAKNYCEGLGMYATYYGEANWQSIPRMYHCQKEFQPYKEIQWETLQKKIKSKRMKFIWTSYNTSSSTGSSETLPIKTSLSSKKNTCEDIGFSPNTDPFANCVLKLMEIEENKVNRASQAQIANTQRSIEQEIAKDGRDQEAWKFLLGMMGTNGATSSIGGLLSPSSVSCNKTGETTSGTNKICYYNCMGSTKTINVGSMQSCPININK